MLAMAVPAGIGKGESGKAEGRKKGQFMIWEQLNFQGNGEENLYNLSISHENCPGVALKGCEDVTVLENEDFF